MPEQTPGPGGPGRGPAATPPPADPPKGATAYSVFEPQENGDLRLVVRDVSAAGRPDAIEKAIAVNAELKERVVEKRETVNLLPLARKNLNPEPVSAEPRTGFDLKIGGGA